MKRQISISILLAVFVIILAWLYIKYSNEASVEDGQNTTEKSITNEESISISQEYELFPYYIKSEYGRLVVYETKNGKIYMETGIEIDTLPIEIKEKTEGGIFFQTEGELYDFLESYSS